MQCIKDCPARVISLKDGKAEIAQQVNIESVLQKESEEL